ncbi:hypothetical protein C7N43_04645 [Sphingobacteriales bacterium UPWRP_1]|nr:hypothetical protein C7N43_04645 [Sphingobacteriales bacterium UPWRP_1]
MKTINLTLLLSIAILTFSCKNEDDNSPISKNALTIVNLKGVWDMNLQETHPDIFVCEGSIIRTVEDCEWAMVEIFDNIIEATAKVRPIGWDPGSICSGTASYSIYDDEHLLIIENGQQTIFKYTLSNNGTKLVVTVLEPGLDPNYPNGAFEVYHKRLIECVVPGIVPIIAQPTTMTCWATTATMMMSWHDNQSLYYRTSNEHCWLVLSS